MKFTSYNFGGSYYEATVKNTVKGIEISDLESKKSAHIPSRPYQVIEEFLSPLKPPYSKIDVCTREGKRELKKHLIEDIEKLEQEIALKKVAIQMCKRKNVYFKEL